MKKPLLLLLLIFISLSVRAQSKDILVLHGAGRVTCGDALSNLDRNASYDAYYTSYIQGYITGRNDASIKNKLVGDGISADTLSVLWKTKCKKEENITSIFFVITEQIYSELLKK